MKNDKDDKDERKRGFKQNPMGIITDRIIEKGFAIVKSNYVEHFVTKQHSARLVSMTTDNNTALDVSTRDACFSCSLISCHFCLFDPQSNISK